MDEQTKWDIQLRKGTLELAILAALHEKPLYGLELLNRLKQQRTMQITEGTLYPLLDRLKREGWLSANWVQEGETRPRKYFALSALGEKQLNTLSTRWRESVKDLESLLEQAGL